MSVPLKETTTLEALRRRWVFLPLLMAALSGYVMLAAVVPRGAAAVQTWQAAGVLSAKTAGAAEALGAMRAEHTADGQASGLSGTFTRLPRPGESSQVVQAIQDAADAHGLRLRHLQPGTTIAQPQHDVLPVSVLVEGGFHDALAFIDALERSSLLIKVLDVALTPAKETGRLEANLRLHVPLVTHPPPTP